VADDGTPPTDARLNDDKKMDSNQKSETEEMRKKHEKYTKTLKYRILNQQLLNFKNIPTPIKTMVIYAILFVCFLSLGLLFLIMALTVNTLGPLEYVDSDGNCLESETISGNTFCRVDFTPEETIVKPHYYIDIKNFYSSHRNYAKSMSRK